MYTFAPGEPLVALIGVGGLFAFVVPPAFAVTDTFDVAGMLALFSLGRQSLVAPSALR